MNENIRVEDLMQKAREFLEDAELLFNHGSYDSAVSRSYYAMFSAARALLLTKGIKPRSHRGTLIMFRREFVKSGLFPREMGDALAKSESLREIGDYSPYPKKIPQEKAREVLEDTRQFEREVKYWREMERKARAKKKKVQQQKQQAKPQNAPEPQPKQNVQREVKDRLRRLKELLDEGLISEEDYKRKKEDILKEL